MIVARRLLEQSLPASAALSLSEISHAVDRAVSALASRQDPKTGRWPGRYLAAPTPTAIYVLFKDKLGQRDERFHRAVSWLRSRQRTDGGWGDGPATPSVPEISQAVRRAMGVALPPGDETLLLADRYLADHPDLHHPLALHSMLGYWGVARTTARSWTAPLRYLAVNSLAGKLPAFFHVFGNIGLLQDLQRRKARGSSHAGLRFLEQATVDQVLADRNLSGEFVGGWMSSPLTTISAVAALRDAGLDFRSPALSEGLAFVERWITADGGLAGIAAHDNWETVSAATALQRSGRPVTACLDAARAFLARTRRPDGRWSWDSRLRDKGFADWDSTSYSAAMLLCTGSVEDEGRVLSAAEQQSRGGGWSAFCRPFPFAAGEYFDASVDITAHVLGFLVEALGTQAPLVRAAQRWLLKAQNHDGSWVGVWYARRTYGIQCAVESLIRSGISTRAEPIQQAVVWLAGRQNSDGGWGESWDGHLIESSVEQTAYAVQALAAAGAPTWSTPVAAGVRYLIERQGSDGSWVASPHVGRFLERVMGCYNTEDYGTIQALSALRAVERSALGQVGVA